VARETWTGTTRKEGASVSKHADFRDFLQALPNGGPLWAACEAYKVAEEMTAYRINGCLKGGHAPAGDDVQLVQRLRQAIRARNTEPLTLYRMTSLAEFVGPLASALLGQPIKYPAFLSTSSTTGTLSIFAPAPGPNLPVLLEIRCPAMTTMALLEANEGLEDEYLLGPGTVLSYVEGAEIEPPDQVGQEMGIMPPAYDKYIKLVFNVTASPSYAVGPEFFDFTPGDDDEDEPEVIP
jgi:hypothetical protein